MPKDGMLQLIQATFGLSGINGRKMVFTNSVAPEF